MKKSLISLLIVFWSSLVFGEKLETLALPKNRVLGYHAQIQKDETKPVLVFMPGIYRGHYAKEPFLKFLKAKKISYVTFHFAEHPESVVLTGKDTPDFSDVTVKDLADEVSAVANELQITQAVPVSLSYSAVLTAHLDREQFPFVIETAPIGKDTDGLPEAVVGFYKFWEAWVKTIPFYGEIWLKQTKEYHLRNHWAPTVDEYADQIPALKKPEYRERAIQGYISLTRSAEGFHFATQNFKTGPSRYFILGENEEADRMAIQKAGVLKYISETKHQDNVYIIPKAGHIIPNDQPAVYAEILSQVLDKISEPNQ